MKAASQNAPRALPHVGGYVLGLLVITVGLGAPAFVISRFEHSLPPGDLLGPGLVRARDVLMFAPLLGPVLLGVWLFVHVRRGLAAMRVWTRWLTLSVLFGAALFGMYVSFVINVVSPRDWLFGSPRPSVSAASPDGSRTAHLASRCMLACELSVYFEERGAATLRRVGVVDNYDHTKPLPAIDWAADSSSVTLRPLVPETFSTTPASLTFP